MATREIKAYPVEGRPQSEELYGTPYIEIYNDDDYLAVAPADMDIPSMGSTSNMHAIIFYDLPSCIVTHAALYNADGNMIVRGALDIPTPVIKGDTISFAPGRFTITLE